MQENKYFNSAEKHDTKLLVPTFVKGDTSAETIPLCWLSKRFQFLIPHILIQIVSQLTNLMHQPVRVQKRLNLLSACLASSHPLVGVDSLLVLHRRACSLLVEVLPLQHDHVVQVVAILVADIIEILVVRRVVQPVYHQERRLCWLMLLVVGSPDRPELDLRLVLWVFRLWSHHHSSVVVSLERHRTSVFLVIHRKVWIN